MTSVTCLLWLTMLQPPSEVNPPAPKVSGVVLSPSDEAPIAGAAVYMLANPSKGYFTLPTHPLKTETDAAGRFSFSGMDSGMYRVWAEKGNLISHAKRLAGESVRVSEDAASPPLMLRLSEGCRFRVTVLERDSQRPIPKATVRFRWPDIERTFTAGDDGVAVVEGARPQELVFDVRADGYAMDVRRVAATKAGTTTELSFTLGPGGTLRGVILDEEQRPIVGAGVSGEVERNPAGLDLGWIVTDKQGRFVVKNVPVGEAIELHASHEDFLDYRDRFQLSPNSDLFEMQIDMKARPRGGSIQVTVVDEKQRPVAGARLVNPSHRSSVQRLATTDEQGQSRMDDVLERLKRYELNVTAKGFAPKRVEFQPGTPDKPQDVRVQLETGHGLSGRVLLADGKPAAKVRVYYNEGEHGNELGGRVDTDAEGRFTVDSLPAQCTFTIYSPKGHAPFDDVPLTLDSDEEVVVRLTEAGVVKGRVVDDATGKVLVPYRIRIMVSPNRVPGEPATGMLTSLVKEGLVITGAEGTFFFGDFPQDMPMRLVVSSDGFEEQTIDRVMTRPASQPEPIEVRLKRSAER